MKAQGIQDIAASMNDRLTKDNEGLLLTSATRQARQQWFSVGIFPFGQLFGLTGNRPQSAPACSFLR